MLTLLCCCCGQLRRKRLDQGHQQQAVQLALLRLAQMQTGGVIRAPCVTYWVKPVAMSTYILRAILRRFQSAQAKVP
jgi:hypothetical protein